MNRLRHRIVSGLTYTLLEKILVQLLSLCAFFIVVSNISLKDFGLLNLLFTFVSVATTLGTLGIDSLIVADTAVYRAQKGYRVIQQLFKEYAAANVVLFFLTFICAWFLRKYTDQFYDANLNHYFWILVLLIMGQAGMNFCSTLFEPFEKFNLLFFMRFSEAFMRTAVILSFFFWFEFSLITVLYAYVIGKITATVLSLPFVLLLLSKVEQSVAPEKRYLLLDILKKHGKWESLINLFQTITANLTPWVINLFVSTEGVALYSFVQKINSLFIKALPVRSVLFPIIIHSVETSKELASMIVTKARKYLFFVYVLVYLLSYLFMGVAIHHFVPLYSDAESLFRISMLRLFIDAFSLGHSPFFYALKQQKITFAINVYAIGASVLLQLLFTYLWGLTGTILSILVLALGVTIVREYILNKLLGFPITRVKDLFTFDAYDMLLLNKVTKNFLHKKSK